MLVPSSMTTVTVWPLPHAAPLLATTTAAIHHLQTLLRLARPRFIGDPLFADQPGTWCRRSFARWLDACRQRADKRTWREEAAQGAARADCLREKKEPGS